MNPDLFSALTQILVALSGAGGVGAYFKWSSEKRQAKAATAKAAAKAKTDEAAADAEVSKAITGSAVEMLKPLRDQIVALTVDLARNRTEMAEARRETEAARQEAGAARSESAALRAELRDLHEWVNVFIDAFHAAGLPIPDRPEARGAVSLRRPPPTPHPEVTT